MAIMKSSLDPSLIAWIANEAGLGPGIGEVHHCVDVDSAYYSWLRDDLKESSHLIHFDPIIGHSELTPSRNDVLLVHPGTYTIGETLTWSKAQTHMLGVGNPTWRQGGKTRIISTVEAATATVDVTGTGVFMGGGLNISQNGAFTACVTALRLSSTYFAAKKLDLRGDLQATIATTAGTSSLEFASGSNLGFASTFEDCNIGTSSGNARGAVKKGVIHFATANVGPGYVEFKKCRILSRSSSTTPTMVFGSIVLAYDRYTLFEDCLFYNFSAAQAHDLLSAFYVTNVSSGSGTFVLRKSTAVGIDEWQNQDPAEANAFVTTDMPITGVGGGLVNQPTAPVGT